MGNGVQVSLLTFTNTLKTTGNPKNDIRNTSAGRLHYARIRGCHNLFKETFNVEPNDVKLNIILSNWAFDTASDFVAVALVIKGSRIDANLREVGINVFDLGRSVPLILVRGRVTVDGSDTEMAAWYPHYTNNGGKYTFEFRFLKVTGSATYDPIVR